MQAEFRLSFPSSLQRTSALQEIGPRKAFLALCLLHAVLWIAVPLLLYHNPPKDALEGVAWGYLWQFGYDKHPFLAPWLSALSVNLFGSVGAGIFVASQAAVVLAFWAVWRLAREMLAPRAALLSVLLLEGVYYYNLASITFNPNVVSLPCWALSIWTFYRAVKVPGAGRWMLAGAMAGLAVLAKYEVAVLFLPMLVLLVATPEGRRALGRPAFYLGLASALLVVSPNLVWLVRHDFLPFHYTMEDMALAQGSYSDAARHADGHFAAPLLFLLEQLGCLLPLAALAWLARGRGVRAAAVAVPRLPRFERRFLLAMSVGPLLTTLLIAVFSGSAMVARWAFPFFGCAGIALVGLGRLQVDSAGVRRAAAGAAGLNALLLLGMAWAVLVQPALDGRAPYSIADPASEEALRVDALWHEQFDQPLPIVAGDRWVIAGIDAFSPDRPRPYFDISARENPWLDDATLRREGAVFVHRLGAGDDGRTFRAALLGRFPRLGAGREIAFARVSRLMLPPVRLWIAVLPPENPPQPLNAQDDDAKVGGAAQAGPMPSPLS